MTTSSLTRDDRSNWRATLADWFAAGVLVTLPWSTSATSVLIVLWLITVIPTIGRQDLRTKLAEPAALLPVLLWALACLGMLWTEGSWAERLEGFRGFHKLLLIPLLMIHFSRSENGLKVLAAFLLSSLLLLIYSWASLAWPSLIWTNLYRVPGIPIKDAIYQSICFVISACALLHVALTFREKGQFAYAALTLAIVLVLLANLAYVANSRTALVLLGLLFMVVGYQRFGWRGAAALAVVAVLFGAAAWSTSSYFRTRVSNAVQGTLQFSPAANTPEAQRIELWRKSLAFIGEAPAIGHGTGSIRREFERSQEGLQGAGALVIGNPHNQSFVVGIQLGIAGIALLWGMWAAHLWLFQGTGLIPWLGTLIVIQNVAASLFNSHLSDFTAGWLYVMGVGILGGLVLRQRQLSGKLDAAPICDPIIPRHQSVS